MVDEIPIYPKERIDITCSDECKFTVMDALKETFCACYDNVNTFGGLRVDLDEGWALVRASNTSPTIRLTVEARCEEDLGTIAEPFTKAIREKIKEEEK
jgi:phosphomannomutase